LSNLGAKNSKVGVIVDIRDELLEGLELLRDGFTSPQIDEGPELILENCQPIELLQRYQAKGEGQRP
jgi:hypothetical protein